MKTGLSVLCLLGISFIFVQLSNAADVDVANDPKNNLLLASARLDKDTYYSETDMMGSHLKFKVMFRVKNPTEIRMGFGLPSCGELRHWSSNNPAVRVKSDALCKRITLVPFFIDPGQEFEKEIPLEIEQALPNEQYIFKLGFSPDSMKPPIPPKKNLSMQEKKTSPVVLWSNSLVVHIEKGRGPTNH